MEHALELCPHTRVETVGVVLKYESAYYTWIHFRVELNVAVSPVFHHLLHLCLRLLRDRHGCCQLTANDVLVFPV